LVSEKKNRLRTTSEHNDNAPLISTPSSSPPITARRRHWSPCEHYRRIGRRRLRYVTRCRRSHAFENATPTVDAAAASSHTVSKQILPRASIMFIHVYVFLVSNWKNGLSAVSIERKQQPCACVCTYIIYNTISYLSSDDNIIINKWGVEWSICTVYIFILYIVCALNGCMAVGSIIVELESRVCVCVCHYCCCCPSAGVWPPRRDVCVLWILILVTGYPARVTAPVSWPIPMWKYNIK